MLKSSGSLDFLFVTSGIPLYQRGGQIILTELSRRLIADGFSVGILHLRDVYGYLYRKTGNELLKKFNSNRPYIHREYEIIANSKFGYHVILPMARRALSINYHEDHSGAKLFFSEKDLNGIKVKKIIATAWQAAYFVKDTDIADEKYYLVQHEEDHPNFSGILSPLAMETYNFDLKKIVINERVRKRFENEKPKKIREGVDLSMFSLEIPPEHRASNVVLFPLRASEEKGARYALEAIKKIRNERPDIKIVAFGNYPRRNVPDDIDYRGIVGRDELPILYNSAAIFVVTSIVEGFGLPGIEAMSCGCAVISTDNGGVREYLINGNNGIIVPIKDPEAIKDAVISLVDEPLKRIEYSMKGLEMVGKFTYETMYDDLLVALN